MAAKIVGVDIVKFISKKVAAVKGLTFAAAVFVFSTDAIKQIVKNSKQISIAIKRGTCYTLFGKAFSIVKR